MLKTVCISAGHGAGDVGAVKDNLREADLTIAIAKRAYEIIRLHSIDCLYVPDNLTLTQTIDWINQRAAQIGIAVDIHINAGGGSGVEGWNFQGNNNESDKLSQFLADACAIESGLPNRGIYDETINRWGRLGFIHDTAPIAALVECGFIDGDYNFLNSPIGIEKMARGIARGCLGYLGVTWNPSLLNPKQAQTIDISVHQAALDRIAALEKELTNIKNSLTTANTEIATLKARPLQVSRRVELEQIRDIADKALR